MDEPVALVTGGARRIGAAIVRALHGAGMRVAVHCNTSVETADALCAELNATRAGSACRLQADLLEPGQAERLVAAAVVQLGRLDVLVNNASTFYPTRVGEVTEAAWNDLIGTNLKAPFFLAQAAAPQLQARQGCIINLVDVHALRPMKGHSVYSTAKAGLMMLTRALARELGPGIRVNGIAPGAILWPESGIDETARQHIIDATTLKRTGEPDDIARTVRFLALEGDYITGEVINVDGGRSLGWG